ncbi:MULTISPECIES: MucR family transcriptional regulator [Methylobacterium]|jgi:predicted transcriptional regulator|uniref:MucR family transcriptional regulator n=1 Tax=Methylobacterium oryzae CBMB20 TaxID=693986 RepID=A0A089NMT7_9HYPH|nr:MULTISPECIES: MucR family transcriptional regulator [Methylobacterium]AIQ87830.1 MucR family transcriptional regulator [Methylobacterium oryzae CBMB20]WFS07860.1 MucR family transcriptional regulator [Methylobacterium sp. 391_Methyba4]
MEFIVSDSAANEHSPSVDLTVDIVAAYVSNNSVPASELPGLIGGIHAALSGLTTQSRAANSPVEKMSPSQIRKSVTADHIISFEDGKPYKTLRRHLTLRGLTPEAYREKWGLPRDYPMTAASYSAQRSELARALGLGQQRRKNVGAPAPAPTPEAVVAPASKPRGRKKVVAE